MEQGQASTMCHHVAAAICQYNLYSSAPLISVLLVRLTASDCWLGPERAHTLFSIQSTGPLSLCHRFSSPPSDHCSDSWGAASSQGGQKSQHKHKGFLKKRMAWDGEVKGKQVSLHVSLPTYTPHTPMVLAGQRKWDRLVCAGHSHARTHTHAQGPDGKCVFNKMEPVSGSGSEVCYVISSTLTLPLCDCVTDLGPKVTNVQSPSGDLIANWTVQCILSGHQCY